MSESGWMRGPMLVMVVVMVVVVGSVVGSPQRGRDNDKNPVFNIWEYAISNDNYNPRRDTGTKKDPCSDAIVNCCLIRNRATRDHCFDQNACPGAWFNDLCSKKFKGLVRNVVDQAFFGGF